MTSNMLLRIVSAFIIGPLFIISIIWLNPLFFWLMLIVATGMLYEWYNMTNTSIIDLLVGLIIIPVPIISLLLLSANHDHSWLLLWYFSVIWAVDIFAMLGGKAIGGYKLAPYLSPKKTWSGLIVGILSAGIIAILISKIPGFYIKNNYFVPTISLFIISCILALIAQMSDLFISYFKRKFAIKDSGKIIPGHGGMLDRFDSIILTSPILFLVVNYGSI